MIINETIKSFAVVGWAVSFGLGSVHALEPGDEVKADAVKQATFIKGETPDTWEEGKVYILECWATWCGPCIVAIPHLDELFDKYEEKGLRVIGMNVWEDEEEKVRKFVEQKGEGMSYPVAYVGRGGAFEKDWLTEAKVRGIPHAFIVKDGTYLFSTHPASLTEEVVEGLLEGGERADSIAASIVEQDSAKNAIRENLGAFGGALRKKDVPAMTTALKEVRAIDDDHPRLSLMEISLAIVQKDWEEAKVTINGLSETERMGISHHLVLELDQEEGIPADFLALFIEPLKKSRHARALNKAMEARLLWKMEQRAEALAAAKETIELGKDSPTEPYESFVKSFEEEKPQTIRYLMDAILKASREARKKEKALENEE